MVLTVPDLMMSNLRANLVTCVMPETHLHKYGRDTDFRNVDWHLSAKRERERDGQCCFPTPLSSYSNVNKSGGGGAWSCIFFSRWNEKLYSGAVWNMDPTSLRLRKHVDRSNRQGAAPLSDRFLLVFDWITTRNPFSVVSRCVHFLITHEKRWRSL